MDGHWPVTEEELLAYADWRYGVLNGETLRGFHDWLADGEEDDDE